MNVTEAVARRISIRAFKPDAPPAATVREILELAARAPSGGNLLLHTAHGGHRFIGKQNSDEPQRFIHDGYSSVVVTRTDSSSYSALE